MNKTTGNKTTGFLDYERHNLVDRDYQARLEDFSEMYQELNTDERQRQGARCMDCGVPFCQSEYGCPVDNLIPEWNDLIRQGRWKEAYLRLRQTNNFPEYTGKICPAPCESACVLGINESPVTIKDNEWSIIERAYREGWMAPSPPKHRSGKHIAIIGSGPAGLAAADQLNQLGHTVTVYERDSNIGGLLVYGIPNMKLEKELVARRNDIMAAEGVIFRTDTEVGVDLSIEEVRDKNDAVLLTIGSTIPKPLALPGHDLPGIHFAMEFLHGVTQHLFDATAKQRLKGIATTIGEQSANGAPIDTYNKDVIVIGSGDTGTDCIATAARQHARSLVNFGWRDAPQETRTNEYPWPFIPRILKFDYAHKEAKAKYGRDPRTYNILTEQFVGTDRIRGVKTVEIKWHKDDPGSAPRLEKVPGSEHIWPADIVFIALGYTGPEPKLIDALSLHTTERGTIATTAPRTHNAQSYETTKEGVFVAGDARRGQSLVVWAIKEGRDAAAHIDQYVTTHPNKK